LAKQFGDKEHLQKIMVADTADAVQYTMEDVPGDKEVNEGKWNDALKPLLYDIMLLKFTSYPELQARLLQTQTAMLGAYVPRDNLLGIGISLEDVRAKQVAEWSGQNMVGKVIMDVRTKLQQEQQQRQQQAKPKSKRVIRNRPKPIDAAAVPANAAAIPAAIPAANAAAIPATAVPTAIPAANAAAIPATAVPTAAAIEKPVSRFRIRSIPSTAS
jgi:ribA/ribD-fused uncharacterized protein